MSYQTHASHIPPHQRKHFPSPSEYEPWSPLKPRTVKWQLDLCENNEFAADIFNELWWVYTGRLHMKQSPVMKFTEQQIGTQAFTKPCTEKTARKWLRWLHTKGFIEVRRPSRVRLRGKYPDRTAHITMRLEAVNAWLQNSGYATKTTQPPTGNDTGSHSSRKTEPECHTQQVQNSRESGDLPTGNDTGLSIGTNKEDPLTPFTNSKPEDQDSPSKTMGTRFSSDSKRGTRHLTWNIGVDPIPNDAKLQEFARSRWCMALAAMFQIRYITQPEARKVVRRVKELSMLQILWVQVCYLPRHPEPWLGSWADVMVKLEETTKRLNPAWDDTALSDVKQEVDARLNRKAGNPSLQAIFDAADAAKATPLTDADADDMHTFAATWREFLKLRKRDADTASDDAYAWMEEQSEFMIIRPKYNSSESPADASSGTLQSPGEPPHAPTLNPVPTPVSQVSRPGDVDLLEEMIAKMYEPQSAAQC